MIELRKTVIVERERLEAGTRLSVEAHFLGIKFNQRAECTHHEPPRRFETRSVGGRFYFEAGFTLHEDPAGTRIEGWGNASSPRLFRMAEPVLHFFIERQVDGDLERMKRRIEAPV